jgi:predicted ribonuclease YlaK
MKKFILLTIFCTSVGIASYAQQTDPTLTGAVIAQSEMLKKIFNNREKTQNKIIIAETAVTAAMERMHKVEDQMLDYLSNVQGAMQNLYQIKRAAELTTTEIPKNMSLLKKSLPGHLKGTAIALLVSDELTDAATQMASLYPFMKQLVTSGSYTTSDYDANGKAWQIRTMSWNDLWFGLDPEGWASFMSGKAIAEQLIYEWKYL